METRGLRLRLSERGSGRRLARKLAAGAASIIVVTGTITVLGVGVAVIDSAPAAAALSCTDNWTGTAGTSDWNTATNWSAGIPNSSSDACIGGSSTVVIPNASFSVAELTVSSGSTLTVGVSGGTPVAQLSVNGGTENDGTLTAGPSGSGTASLALNGSVLNTGTMTTDGVTTIGNSTATSVTNQGTWTLGSAGTVNMGGTSSLTQSGTGALLTNANTTANSFNDGGTLTVDGGTICGTGIELHGATNTLTFGSSPPAGPACGVSQALDQIVLGSGTNQLTGDVPAAYTLTVIASSTLQPIATLTSRGAISLDYGSVLQNTASTTFTNDGTLDVPTNANGSEINAIGFVNGPSGTLSVEGTLTIGNSFGSTLTNQGTWTLGSAGTVTMGGTSSLTQSGTGALLTNANTTANSFNDGGTLTVDGGTICGTGIELHGAINTLTFGSSPPAGPACGVSQALDQIVLGSGTNQLTGDVPAAYTLTVIASSTLQPIATLTSRGAISLDYGSVLQNTASTTFTNDGTLDVPTNANGSEINAIGFVNGPSGTLSVEGTLTIGNSFGSTLTNQGTWTLGSAGTVTMGGTSSLTQSGTGALLTNANTTANSFNDGGTLTVDGGTICGTGIELHGATNTLTFGSSPPAGPACGVSQALDQIVLGSGTNQLTGDVPAAYTLTVIASSTLQPIATLTSRGAISLDYGSVLQNTASTTFTNDGTLDVPTNANGSEINAIGFVNGPSGTLSVEGTLTIGNSFGSTVTNQGTWTLGSAGTVIMSGTSSLTQNGLLSDTNTTANSFNDGGTLTVDGGTICGSGVEIHGATNTLTFGTAPLPGPGCPASLSQDEIVLGSGTNQLTGNVPAGYTLLVVSSASLEPTTSLTNNGAIILDYGSLLASTGTTLTNAGTFDVPANVNGSTVNIPTFHNGSTGTLDVEGTLTIGNSFASSLTNDGTVGIAPGGLINFGGTSSVTNESDGTLAFGIDGLPSSTGNYGRITNGTLVLGGAADPVFDGGYTPPSSTEYFVWTGSASAYSGTFSTIDHNATADYSHNNEVGLVGGAPATGTTTSVASSANPSVWGQSVQLTATVTPSTGSNPSGSVSFYSNGTLLGSAPVTSTAGVSTATLSISNMRVGADSITATYNGDVVFNASTSTPLAQTVNQDPPNVTVSPNPTSPVPGQQETYTAQVTATAPGAGTPTGAVSLTDNGTPIPGCQHLVMGPLGPSFVTCSVTYSQTGSHAIVATYAGDTDFSGNTGNDTVTVQPATTSTMVTSSANPGPIGAPVTYTATVGVLPPGTGTPTGNVSFTDNGSPVATCQNVPLPTSAPLQVMCSETYGSNASHAIVATYSGDTNDASSHGSLGETLQQISTQTTIGASTANPTYGQDVTFTATVTPSQSASVNPSGTVTFVDNGSTTIGSGSVSTTAGVTTATLDISNLGAGFHSVTATYNGDTTFTTSTSSSPATLTVAEATTSLSLKSSANPSVVGQSVTFTATLSSSASGETGTVDFADGGLTIGSGTVSGGQATFQTSTLVLGDHTVTAVYEGDLNFVGSSSTSAVIQEVDQASTSVGVTADHNPGSVGQTITYTATVTVNGPGSGVPTETVSFSDGGSAISTCQGVSLSLSSPFTATCQQNYATNASHTITATYSGDGNFVGATSGDYTENLAQTSTTTSVQASPSSSNYGQSVTLTATVSPTTGSGNPTGSVTFTDNGSTSLGSAPLMLVAGVETATLPVTSLPVGADSISASCGGGSGFLASSSTTPAPVSVSQATTSLVVGSSVNASTFGQSVTFTATITPSSGSGETGTVTFYDNGASIGTGAVSGGAASLTTSTLAVGTHPITAAYGGDTNFVESTTTTTLSQVVNKAPTGVSLQSSLNPSNSGQSVTFTATITPTTGSGETGTVTFFDNGSQIGTGSVSTGQATFSTSSLSVATHPITASYGGDGNFAASALSNTVNQVVQTGALIPTVVSLTSSANPSTVSVNVTLTASVLIGGGGASNFSGTMTFSDGSTVLGTSPVNATGLASITLPQLATATAIGTHSITAAYSGNSIYAAGGTSSAFSQVVASPVYSDDKNGTNLVIANSATNAVVNTFPVGITMAGTCFCGATNYLAVSPDGTSAWLMIGSITSTALVQLNTATGAVMRSETLPISGAGIDLKMSPNGADVDVLMEASAATVVLVVPTAPNAIPTLSLPVPGPANGVPHALAINPAGTEAAVTGQNGVEFMSLPSGAPYTTMSMGFVTDPGADGVTFSPNGAYAYATNGAHRTAAGGGTVIAMTTISAAVVNTFTGMTAPVAITASPDGTQLFVANQGATLSGTGPQFLGIVNLATHAVTTVATPTCTSGCGVVNVATNPSGTLVYLSLYLDADVAVYSASTHGLVGTISGYPPGTTGFFGGGGGPTTVVAYGTPPPPPPPPPPVSISTTTLPQATPGAWYSTALAATNGQSPYTWSLVSGSLPSGLSLGSNGFITGTTSVSATTSTFTVKVTDSEFPPTTATKALTLPVAARSTTPPPCGGGGPAPFLPPPSSCVSASNTNPAGTANATSTSSAGSITVTAHGTGGLTVGQYASAPSAGVPFRASSNSFDLALSSLNTFTSITVVDCALAGATSLQWWNPAANGGAGGWQTVTPATYNVRTRCLTITFSTSSSPTLAQLTGTAFVGVLPAETVAISTGGSAPYSLNGQVLSGAITITSQSLVTKVAGTVTVAGATSGDLVSFTVNVTCLFGICSGTFSVNDPGAGVSFTTPTTVTVGPVNANEASGNGVVLPGPGLRNSYPLSWDVTVAAS